MTKDNLLELLMLMIMIMMMNCFCGVVWLTDGRCLALSPAKTIVRDPPYRESPTRCEKGILKTTTRKWKILYLQMLTWLQLRRSAIYF